MLKNYKALLCMLLCATICLRSAHGYAHGWVVVNTSSQPNILPANASVRELPDIAHVAAVTDGQQVYPVDIIGDEIYIGCVAGAMCSLRLTATENTFPDPVTPHSDGLEISFLSGAIRFAARGPTLLLNGREVLKASSTWQVGYQGRGAVELVNDTLTAICFSTGGMLLTFERTDQIELCGSIEVVKPSRFLIPQEAVDGEQVDAPVDYVVLAGNAVLVPAPQSRFSFIGSSKLASRKGMQVLIGPQHDQQQGLLDAAAASMPLLGRTINGGWKYGRFAREGYDIWVVMSGEQRLPNLRDNVWIWRDSSSKPVSALVFSQRDGQSLCESFDLRAASAGAIALDSSRGMIRADILGQQGDSTSVKPTLVLTDYSPRGIFLQGDLLRGGAVFCGRAGRDYALDLDNDGDGDIFGGYMFDLFDNMPGFFTVKAEQPGLLVMDSTGGYTEQVGAYNWMFRKTYLASSYRGARRGFEEHFLYRIRAGQINGPIQGPASLFLKTTDDCVDRLSMGAFGEDDHAYMGWNIELDPIEYDRDQPEAYRICEYCDPYGHVERFTSCVFPQTWDGQALAFTKQPDGGYDFTPADTWYQVCRRDLFDVVGVRMTAFPQGQAYNSSEGMYHGALCFGSRIEKDIKGRQFVVYYSDLMGALHLKNADFGYQGHANGHVIGGHPCELNVLYHRWAVDMPGRFWGGREVDELEGARLEGPMYLAYFDENRDGFFDTYVYDADNNGLADRVLHYDETGQFVCLRDRGYTTAWAWQDRREQVDYLPANYNQIEALHLRGALVQPMVIRTFLADSGIPIERVATTEGAFPTMKENRPEMPVIFGPQWQVRIALDLAHGRPERLGWEDLGPCGFSGMALHAGTLGLTLTTLTEEFDATTLADVDILVMQDTFVPMKTSEIEALRHWVQYGGVLLIVPANDDELTRIGLDAVAGLFDASVTQQRIQARSSIWKYGLHAMDWTDTAAAIEEKRAPGLCQTIDHYDSAVPGLLDDFDYLTCVGYVLDAGTDWRVVLRYDGQVMMAETELGQGYVLLCGMNIFANKYINHIQYIEPLSSNTWFLKRLLCHVTQRTPVLTVQRLGWENEWFEVSFRGRGGKIKLMRHYGDGEVLLDQESIAPVQRGLFEILPVAGGEHVLRVRR